MDTLPACYCVHSPMYQRMNNGFDWWFPFQISRLLYLHFFSVILKKMYVLTKNKESVSAYIPNIICFAFCTFSDNARWAQDIPWLDTSMVLLILQALSISASQFRSLASSTCQIISPLESHPVLHTRPCLVALCKVFESKFFIVEVLNIN